MFADYEYLVVAAYRRKKGDPDFPLNLRVPTPARLREACIQACRDRFDKRDVRVIRDFFGQGNDRQECLHVIKQVAIDRFRPLIKYLDGETGKTDEKNIELLAWLIDFPLRPYDYTRKYEVSEQAGDDAAARGDGQVKVEAEGSSETAEDLTQRPVIREVITGGLTEQPAVMEGGVSDVQPDGKAAAGGALGVEPDDLAAAGGTGGNRKQDGEGIEKASVPGHKAHVLVNADGGAWGVGRDKVAAGEEAVLATGNVLPEGRYRQWALVAILLLAAGGAGLFWWWDNRQSTVLSANYSGGCMYWAGDHYQPVACNEKIGDALIVALDTARVRSFKKITDWQNITRDAIGNVWYLKSDNTIELFTAAGYHPVEVRRVLKPLSPYMYDKYVLPIVRAK